MDSAGIVGIWTRRNPYWRKRQEMRWAPVPCPDELKGLVLGCGLFTLWEIDPECEDDVQSVTSDSTDNDVLDSQGAKTIGE